VLVEPWTWGGGGDPFWASESLPTQYDRSAQKMICPVAVKNNLHNARCSLSIRSL
jgi:hypothetical protein